jgi:hypothetical protein
VTIFVEGVVDIVSFVVAVIKLCVILTNWFAKKKRNVDVLFLTDQFDTVSILNLIKNKLF